MLKKLHHVGLVVKSADAALGFYRDVLGLPVMRDEVLRDQGVRGVLIPVGETEIELLEPTRDDTGIARYLASKGESLHHLCFESDDVAAELDAARAKGLQLVDQAPRRAWPAWWASSTRGRCAASWWSSPHRSPVSRTPSSRRRATPASTSRASTASSYW
ncbi:MAG: VOC family protein [Dehalococcoidia bacterium]